MTGPWRRIVLVGFMGSGKTEVGGALGRELGWAFEDLDAAVEERAGASVPEIFRTRGEQVFRELEGTLGDELLEGEGIVLATGGGWPCRPDRIDRLDEGSLSVWLRVSVEGAVARVHAQGGGRPLLAVDDPTKRARELLDERERWYERARWHVDGEAGTPDEVARRIADRLRTDPERPLRD